MPLQIWLSHLRISFHALSLTMTLSSWSLRGSYFAFVYTYLMLKIKFTSSHGLLGPSLFLVAACLCKTKKTDTSFFSFYWLSASGSQKNPKGNTTESRDASTEYTVQTVWEYRKMRMNICLKSVLRKLRSVSFIKIIHVLKCWLH